MDMIARRCTSHQHDALYNNSNHTCNAKNLNTKVRPFIVPVGTGTLGLLSAYILRTYSIAGYCRAASAATWPANVVTRFFLLVMLPSSLNSPVSEAVRGDIRTDPTV